MNSRILKNIFKSAIFQCPTGFIFLRVTWEAFCKSCVFFARKYNPSSSGLIEGLVCMDKSAYLAQCVGLGGVNENRVNEFSS